MDFFQELNNAWQLGCKVCMHDFMILRVLLVLRRLPYLDEYYETLTPELRSLDWREEET